MIRGNRPRLTRDERALLTCIARGLKAKQTTFELGICRSSYFRRRAKLLSKLGALNDWQAGILTERYQLVDVGTQNRIEDRREERLDALRSAP